MTLILVFKNSIIPIPPKEHCGKIGRILVTRRPTPKEDIRHLTEAWTDPVAEPEMEQDGC
jgi:hypothetical protein